MLLCDTIIHIASNLHRYRHSEPACNDGIKWFSSRVSHAVRYVLDDSVMMHSGVAMLARPNAFASCVKLLRIPHQLIWIEFNDQARTEARRRAGLFWNEDQDNYGTERIIPTRTGFLIESEQDGRSGKISYCWIYPGSMGPELCSVYHRFDLDGVTNGDRYFFEVRALSSQQHQRRAVTDEESLGYLDSLAVGDIADWALPIYKSRIDRGRDEFKEYLERDGSNIEVEFCELLSILIMMAAKNGSQNEFVSKEKLNRQRIKKGKPMLLDHYTVSMRLSGTERRASTIGAYGSSGQRRTHLVAGHYVVRKVPRETIFYRRGHMRGLGSGVPLATKTVKVIA